MQFFAGAAGDATIDHDCMTPYLKDKQISSNAPTPDDAIKGCGSSAEDPTDAISLLMTLCLHIAFIPQCSKTGN